MSNANPLLTQETELTNYIDDNIIKSNTNIDNKTAVVNNDYLQEENKYLSNEDKYKNLMNILNVRKKMLEVNSNRNDVKNKIIYSFFALIMIIIIIGVSIHMNYKK